MPNTNGPYLSLEDVFIKMFLSCKLNCNYVLLTIGSNTVAIFKIDEVVFKVFESHSRVTICQIIVAKSHTLSVGLTHLTVTSRLENSPCILSFFLYFSHNLTHSQKRLSKLCLTEGNEMLFNRALGCAGSLCSMPAVAS